MAFLAAVPFLIAFMAGCSGSGHHVNANNVPVVLTIQDQPPTGITVVSLTVQITGVTLQGSTGTQSSVSLLSSPVTVNLSNLQTMDELLANTSAPAGTYDSIMVTFANASMTITEQLDDDVCGRYELLSSDHEQHNSLHAGTGVQSDLDYNFDFSLPAHADG